MLFINEKIIQFRDDYEFLSNFAQISIYYNGKFWPTSEHLFQALKTKDHALQEYVRVQKTPAAAKRIGRSEEIEGIKFLRSDWPFVKLNVMKFVIDLKFDQNPECRNLLLATGDSFLEEGNYWHDNIWGNCSCSACKNKQGLNFLGIILMKKRKDIRNVPF